MRSEALGAAFLMTRRSSISVARTSLGAAAIYESTSFGVFMLFLSIYGLILHILKIRYILFPKMRRTSKLLLRMDALQASLSIQDRHAFRRLMLLRLMNFVPGNG